MYTIIRDFFWFCAGVNKEILLECKVDFSKYFTIGATVFFTAIFASLSAGFAIYTVFSGSSYVLLAAVVFGAIWGLTIFNIDRYLIISIKKEGNPSREIWMAVPRLALALVIGIVIARPLELKIFDKEIKEALKTYYRLKKMSDISKDQTAFNSNFAGMINDLNRNVAESDTLKKNLDESEKLMDAELNGYTVDQRTSGRRGPGRNFKKDSLKVSEYDIRYKEKLKEIDRLKDQLANQRKIFNLDTVSVSLEHKTDSLAEIAGFYDRNKMLEVISSWSPFGFLFPAEKDTAKSLAPYEQVNPDRAILREYEGKKDKTVFFVSMLFILVECMPVLAKLMSKRSVYDITLEHEEERLRYLSRYETYANKHLISRLATAQNEVISAAIGKWKEKELNDDNLGSKYFDDND